MLSATTPHPLIPESRRDHRACGITATFALVLFVMVAPVFTGCSRSAATMTRDSRPGVLRIGGQPSDEEPQRRVRFDGLVAYLSRRLHMRVELTQIEAFRARKIEIGSPGPLGYIIGHDKTGIEPLVVTGTADGHHSTYRAVLVVPKDSPLNSIDDVKARASTLTIAWVDPASTSGFMVPQAYLKTQGIHAAKDFKQEVFTLSHLTSAMTAKSGKVDIAGMSLPSIDRLVAKERIGADDLRILWRSEPMIIGVTAIRGDLPEDFRNEVRRAYLDFAREVPDVWKQFRALYPDPATVWVQASDAGFDDLRAIARSIDNAQLIE